MAKRKSTKAAEPGPAEEAAAKPAKPRPADAKDKDDIYQLKITLRDIKPPIWRRIQVPDCSLAKLHDIIQVVMGWDDQHLHSFEVGEQEYSDPRMTEDSDMKDTRRARLSRLVPKEGFKFHYTYDFGDNWEHESVVEEILPPEEGRKYPVCLTGKRACPPEDVGGPWGYADFVEAILDPEHERHEEYLE